MAITGTGTISNPYIVHNLSELTTVSQGKGTYWTQGQRFYTQLADNIDAAGIDWPELQAGVYSPPMVLDLYGNSISNISWPGRSWAGSVYYGNIIKNGTISVNALNIGAPVFGFSGADILVLEDMRINCEAGFKQYYSGYWSYNTNMVAINCSFHRCIVDAIIHYPDMRGKYQSAWNRVSLFCYDNARSSEKYISLSDIHVTCLGACNSYNNVATDSLITNKTSETVRVEKSRITGTVESEDMTFNKFICDDNVVLDTCVIELDFSNCQMSSSYSTGTLIATDAITTAIDTDTLSVFEGRMSAGTGMIPCTYNEIRRYSDLTAKQFPVTRTGETPPEGWNWLITDGYLPYLENFDPPPAPEPGSDKAVYRYNHETGWVKEGSIYVRVGNEWVTGSSDPPTVLDGWQYVRWSGTGSFYGRNVWSDSIGVYMSDGTSSQYIKDPTSNTWTAKSWSGINAQSLYGQNVWFDGTNYYSGNGATQYKLVKGTSTWVDAWTGEYYAGRYVWSDGTDYYYSDNETEPGQYVWDKSTETWKSITWTGLTSFSGQYVWNCKGNTYYSYGSNHYILNKETHEWTRITWEGLSSFYGIDVWTDGVTVYYSNNSTQYKLNTNTMTWTAFTWDGYNSVVGRDIWTDGATWYYSSKSIQYYATGHVVPGPVHELKIHERVNNQWQDK